MQHLRSHAAALAAVAACLLAATRVVECRRDVESDSSLEQERVAPPAAAEGDSFASDVARLLAVEDTASSRDVRFASVGGGASARGVHVVAADGGASAGDVRAAAAEDMASTSDIHLAAVDGNSGAGTATAHAAGSQAGETGSARHLALAAATFHKAARGSAPDPTAECLEDGRGELTGCQAGGCACRWFERCYPRRERERGDVGVCGPSIGLLVAASLAIILSAVGCIVVLRVFFQWRERIQTLMTKDLQYEPGCKEDGEDEPAGTNDRG